MSVQGNYNNPVVQNLATGKIEIDGVIDEQLFEEKLNEFAINADIDLQSKDIKEPLKELFDAFLDVISSILGKNGESAADKIGNVNVSVKTDSKQATGFSKSNLTQEKLDKTLKELENYTNKGYNNFEIQTDSTGEVTGVTIKNSEGKELNFKQDHGILVFAGDKDLYARECYDEYMLYRDGGDSSNKENGMGEFRISHKDGKLMNWDPTGSDDWNKNENSYHFKSFSIDSDENLNNNIEVLSQLPDLLKNIDEHLKGNCQKGNSNRQVNIITDGKGNITGVVITDKNGKTISDLKYEGEGANKKLVQSGDIKTNEQKALEAKFSDITSGFAKSALERGSHGNQGQRITDSNGNYVWVHTSGNVTADGLNQSVRYSYSNGGEKNASDPLFEQIHYDKSGRITSKTTYRRDGLQQTTEYKYDTEGKVTETKSDLTQVVEADFKNISDAKISYKNGRYQTSYVDSTHKGTHTTVFDANGREILETDNYPSNSGCLNVRTETQYTQDGGKIRNQTYTDKDGNITGKWIETSNKEGKWTNITKKENDVTVSVDYKNVSSIQNQNVAWQVMEAGNFPKGTRVDVVLDKTGDSGTIKATYQDGSSKEYTYKYENGASKLTEKTGANTHSSGITYNTVGGNISNEEIEKAIKNAGYEKGTNIEFQIGTNGKIVSSKATKPNGDIETSKYTYNNDGSITREITAEKAANPNEPIMMDGKEKRSITDFPNGKKVEVTETSKLWGGFTTKTVTTEGDKVTTETMWNDGLVGGSSSKYDKSVTINGKLTEETHIDYWSASTVEMPKTEKGYTIKYVGNNIIKTEFKNESESDPDTNVRTKNNLTEEYYNGVLNKATTEVIANDGKKTIKETNYYSDGRIYYQDSYEYDANGKKLSKVHTVENGGGTGSYMEIYNDDGSTKMTIKDWNMDKKTDSILIYDAATLNEMPQTLEANAKIKVEMYDKNQKKYITLGYAQYDANGNLSSVTRADGKKAAEYRYNSDGRKIETKNYDENGKINTIMTHHPTGEVFSKNQYNNNGQVTKSEYTHPDGSLMFAYTYKYDSNGNEIYMEKRNSKNQMTSNRSSSENICIDRTFSYNADGTLKSWIQKISNNGKQYRELTYEAKAKQVKTYDVIEKTDKNGNIYYEKKLVK